MRPLCARWDFTCFFWWSRSRWARVHIWFWQLESAINPTLHQQIGKQISTNMVGRASWALNTKLIRIEQLQTEALQSHQSFIPQFLKVSIDKFGGEATHRIVQFIVSLCHVRWGCIFFKLTSQRQALLPHTSRKADDSTQASHASELLCRLCFFCRVSRSFDGD